MIYLISQIPQDIRNRFSPLQQITASCQIGSEVRHIFPPGLSAQERRTDTGPRKRSAGRQEADLRVMCIGMEDQMRHPFYAIYVCHLLQHRE